MYKLTQQLATATARVQDIEERALENLRDATLDDAPDVSSEQQKTRVEHRSDQHQVVVRTASSKLSGTHHAVPVTRGTDYSGHIAKRINQRNNRVSG